MSSSEGLKRGMAVTDTGAPISVPVGNGVLTVDVTTPVLAGAKSGVYAVRCTSLANGTVAAAGTATAVTGSTGNGTITASPATGAGALQGTYSIVCEKTAADGGIFNVTAPDGSSLGKATVGTAFTTQLTFTIADGSTDFVVGDAFNVVVGGEKNETFHVADPDGFDLGIFVVSGVAGSTTWANDIKFALVDGTTDFIVGDGFDITVAAGSLKYVKAVYGALDGTGVGAAILLDDIDATSGDVSANLLTTTAQVDVTMLIYDTSANDSTKKGILRAGLEANNVQFLTAA